MSSDKTDPEWLNTEAFFALDGMRSLIADRLIALLRSNAPIDPIVREQLARALERRASDPGIRLEIHGTGSGNSDSAGAMIEKRQDWLAIGRRIQNLVNNGMTIDDAKREVKSIVGPRGNVIGCSASQASNIWRYYREFQSFVEANASITADFSRIGVDPEQMLGSMYIWKTLDPAVLERLSAIEPILIADRQTDSD